MLVPITTQLVTDTNAMLPAVLLDRYGILEVPLTIVIDGIPYGEHQVDLAEFYCHLRNETPLSTAAPSPGEVLATYKRAIQAGATTILSIHVGSNQSATVNAARLAAAETDIPVRVVDTGTASFMEGCCVWRAAEVLADGGDIDAAATAAEAVGRSARSVFTIGEITRALQGGRLQVDDGPDVPVFASAGPDMREIARVTSQEAAIETMTTLIGAAAGPLRAGIGHADADAAADALEAAIGGLPEVAETIRYLVGPSMATHTGAGTFGAVFHQI